MQAAGRQRCRVRWCGPCHADLPCCQHAAPCVLWIHRHPASVHWSAPSPFEQATTRTAHLPPCRARRPRSPGRGSAPATGARSFGRRSCMARGNGAGRRKLERVRWGVCVGVVEVVGGGGWGWGGARARAVQQPQVRRSLPQGRPRPPGPSPRPCASSPGEVVEH